MLPRGTKLGKHRLQRKIGDGGFATVYRALDTIEGTHVALKVPRPDLGAGTTLAVVQITGDVMRRYHAGDSMILMVGQRGRIKVESIAHSPVGYGIESGLLDAADATTHEDRHLV